MRLTPLLGALLLVGCFNAGPTGTESFTSADYDAIEAAIGAPVVVEHEHDDPAEHDASYNLQLVAQVKGEPGRVPLQDEAYVETAIKNGYAYVSRTGPEEGLVIFDVADVENPKFVGYARVDAGFEPDIEVSDDGKWAFWETQRAHIAPPQAPDPSQPQVSAPNGVHVFDISDKANPRWVTYSATPPDGPHSITYASIGGRHILLQSVYAHQYSSQGREVPQTQRLVISELDTSTPTPTLRTIAEYREPGATGRSELLPHDVSVAVHPITQKTYAYLAYWDVGIVILDLTDPAAPTKVGSTTDFGPAPYADVHMVRQFPGTIAGRVIAVAEPEIGEEEDSGYMTFHDVTDPAAPKFVSAWRIPGNITSLGGALGPHYFDVADGRVALASYHAGFWVIDVHNEENLLRPRTVGFALVNATGDDTLLGAVGSAFDAWWYQGYFIGGDYHGGLSVFRYTGPAPKQEP